MNQVLSSYEMQFGFKPSESMIWNLMTDWKRAIITDDEVANAIEFYRSVEAHVGSLELDGSAELELIAAKAFAEVQLNVNDVIILHQKIMSGPLSSSELRLVSNTHVIKAYKNHIFEGDAILKILFGNYRDPDVIKLGAKKLHAICTYFTCNMYAYKQYVMNGYGIVTDANQICSVEVRKHCKASGELSAKSNSSQSRIIFETNRYGPFHIFEYTQYLTYLVEKLGNDFPYVTLVKFLCTLSNKYTFDYSRMESFFISFVEACPHIVARNIVITYKILCNEYEWLSLVDRIVDTLLSKGISLSAIINDSDSSWCSRIVHRLNSAAKPDFHMITAPGPILHRTFGFNPDVNPKVNMIDVFDIIDRCVADGTAEFSTHIRSFAKLICRDISHISSFYLAYALRIIYRVRAVATISSEELELVPTTDLQLIWDTLFYDRESADILTILHNFGIDPIPFYDIKQSLKHWKADAHTNDCNHHFMIICKLVKMGYPLDFRKCSCSSGDMFESLFDTEEYDVNWPHRISIFDYMSTNDKIAYTQRIMGFNAKPWSYVSICMKLRSPIDFFINNNVACCAISHVFEDSTLSGNPFSVPNIYRHIIGVKVKVSDVLAYMRYPEYYKYHIYMQLFDYIYDVNFTSADIDFIFNVRRSKSKHRAELDLDLDFIVWAHRVCPDFQLESFSDIYLLSNRCMLFASNSILEILADMQNGTIPTPKSTNLYSPNGNGTLMPIIYGINNGTPSEIYNLLSLGCKILKNDVIRICLHISPELKSATLLSLRNYIAESNRARDYEGKLIERFGITANDLRTVPGSVYPSAAEMESYAKDTNTTFDDLIYMFDICGVKSLKYIPVVVKRCGCGSDYDYALLEFLKRFSISELATPEAGLHNMEPILLKKSLFDTNAYCSKHGLFKIPQAYVFAKMLCDFNTAPQLLILSDYNACVLNDLLETNRNVLASQIASAADTIRSDINYQSDPNPTTSSFGILYEKQHYIDNLAANLMHIYSLKGIEYISPICAIPIAIMASSRFLLDYLMDNGISITENEIRFAIMLGSGNLNILLDRVNQSQLDRTSIDNYITFAAHYNYVSFGILLARYGTKFPTIDRIMGIMNRWNDSLKIHKAIIALNNGH